ncbi:MAG: TetR family transcriptional regulator, partial [Verrucomicrobiota bacterium]
MSIANHSQTPHETKLRILDTAEELFADQGFEAVSLRKITQAAEVNLAAVNYHFGSKEALVSEVMLRILAPINEQRLELLSAAEAAYPDGVPTRLILEALYRPVLLQVQRGGDHRSRFIKLAGQCLRESERTLPETLAKLLEEIIERFLAAILKSQPHLTKEVAFWRLHLIAGSLLFSLTKGGQIAVLSRGAVKEFDPEKTLDHLIEFNIAGLEAPMPDKKRSLTGLTTALAAAAAFFLSSCAATAPPDATGLSDVSAPGQWSAQKSSAAYHPTHTPDRFWIDHFGDTHLNAFVREVLENNKDVKVAQSRIDIALANARIAGADLYPSVGASLSGRRQKQNFIGLP